MCLLLSWSFAIMWSFVVLLLCCSVSTLVVSRVDAAEKHPCSRECKDGEAMNCNYYFSVTEYVTMRPTLCKNCSTGNDTMGELEGCQVAGCIPGGGRVRIVSTVNRTVPGPEIEVCHGDRVIVHVTNHKASEGVVLHWHGIHQTGTPYMDGVPYLTQCPIQPHTTFVYNFTADTPGTHMWHAHIGFQEADGMFGTMIIRRPVEQEPNSDRYDFDLSEHTMIVWHWFGQATGEVLTSAKYIEGRFPSGEGFIINGLGGLEAFDSLKEDTFQTIPRARFTVEQDQRYRFRVIYNTAISCPVQLSVEGHRLLAIASDSAAFNPVAVDSIMLNGGERYDFVLQANQTSDNYWIRFRGMGRCRTEIRKVHQEAILHYSDADDTLPSVPTYEDAIVDGVLLNPIGEIGSENYTDNSLIYVSDLTNADTNQTQNITGNPTEGAIYIEFKSNRYASEDIPGPWPQVNSRTFGYPSFPLLTQRSEITRDLYCTDENKTSPGVFTACPYLYNIKLNSLVEIVFVDLDVRGGDHPFHLHGGQFHVVALGIVGENITTEAVKELDEKGEIERNLNGPLKDTVSVPSGGYAVVRFNATNPGFWFFHCHISDHAEMGMGFVLQVGEVDEMPETPHNFPMCGHWKMPPPSKASSMSPMGVALLLLYWLVFRNTHLTV